VIDNAKMTVIYLVQNLFVPLVYLILNGVASSTAGGAVKGSYGSWLVLSMLIGVSNEFACSS